MAGTTMLVSPEALAACPLHSISPEHYMANGMCHCILTGHASCQAGPLLRRFVESLSEVELSELIRYATERQAEGSSSLSWWIVEVPPVDHATHSAARVSLIKLLRTVIGCGLLDAKNMVEAVVTGHPIKLESLTYWTPQNITDVRSIPGVRLERA